MRGLLLIYILGAALVPAATSVVILGTGTPRADAERSGPAVAVIYDGRSFLFDAGPGVVRRAAAAAARHKIAALQMPQLQRVFLTHLHSDHTLGLPDLIFSPWVLHRESPLEIYGPKGTKEMVRHIEAAWREDIAVRTRGLENGNTTGYKANAHEIKPGVVFKQEGVEITAFPVHHGSWKQAFGYRIVTPDRTIVISGDCAPSDEVIKACNGCDVLLHEVYSLEERKHPPRPGWTEYLNAFHTSTEEVARIANTAKPKLLVLYHQLINGATDDGLVSEVTAEYAGRVVSAHDLDIY